MEAFMVKAWIGKTNFYETVKKKEAEKRAEKKANSDAEGLPFAEVLKQQWEEKKKEMEQQQAAARKGTAR